MYGVVVVSVRFPCSSVVDAARVASGLEVGVDLDRGPQNAPSPAWSCLLAYPAVCPCFVVAYAVVLALVVPLISTGHHSR
jgi:hypothetical protein